MLTCLGGFSIAEGVAYHAVQRVLITGGAGFIGSHLAEVLVTEGKEVFVIDDLSTGSVTNIAHLQDNPNFHFTKGSILSSDILEPLVDQVDFIYHLAAAVGVELVVRSPVFTIENNVRGTESVLAAAAKRSIGLLLTSTSEVYGKSVHDRFREDDDLSDWSAGFCALELCVFQVAG